MFILCFMKSGMISFVVCVCVSKFMDSSSFIHSYIFLKFCPSLLLSYALQSSLKSVVGFRYRMFVCVRFPCLFGGAAVRV